MSKGIITKKKMPKCAPMKIIISPTQADKFEKCKQMETMPIRVYVQKDHNGDGGYEIAATIVNPVYDAETAELEGEGVKKNLKRLKKVVKFGGKVAGFAAPVVALVAPPVGLGLGVASAATRAVLGDGEMPPPVVEEAPQKTKRSKKKRSAAGEVPRYTVAKKKKH
jgi:hypothetical protein